MTEEGGHIGRAVLQGVDQVGCDTGNENFKYHFQNNEEERKESVFFVFSYAPGKSFDQTDFSFRMYIR